MPRLQVLTSKFGLEFKEECDFNLATAHSGEGEPEVVPVQKLLAALNRE